MQAQLFPQIQPPRAVKINRYDAADMSHLALPADEPLSAKIIEAHREFAYSVIEQALNDLLSENESERRNAEEFCLSSDPAHRRIRMLWLGWLQMDEEILAKAAKKRLGLLRARTESTSHN